jgi:hypothetical protein
MPKPMLMVGILIFFWANKTLLNMLLTNLRQGPKFIKLEPFSSLNYVSFCMVGFFNFHSFLKCDGFEISVGKQNYVTQFCG